MKRKQNTPLRSEPLGGGNCKLGVNIDHAATLRQVRGSNEPDPVWVASAAELVGAHGITVHLREDRRHIQERDVLVLRETVSTKLNLEIAGSPDVVELALRFRPDIVCLVPERREEVTTEGGLNVLLHKKMLMEVVRSYHGEGIPVSLFVDPLLSQLEAAVEVGADYVEIHTGTYANASNPEAVQRELEVLSSAVGQGLKLGLGINAGHGLNYRNVRAVASIPGIEELNIGHSIMARSLFVGVSQAVREMLATMRGQVLSA